MHVVQPSNIKSSVYYTCVIIFLCNLQTLQKTLQQRTIRQTRNLAAFLEGMVYSHVLQFFSLSLLKTPRSFHPYHSTGNALAKFNHDFHVAKSNGQFASYST